jgi:hypothetical protein
MTDTKEQYHEVSQPYPYCPLARLWRIWGIGLLSDCDEAQLTIFAAPNQRLFTPNEA